MTLCTDKKLKQNFPHILGNSEGSGAKSYLTNGLLIYGENMCAIKFPYTVYEKNFVFFFISVLSLHHQTS
jgi:hypothetical protein